MGTAFDKLATTAPVFALLLLVLLTGCDRHIVTGGYEIPVTAATLTGAQLTDIKGDVTWLFSKGVVRIENQGQPVPVDVAELLLGKAIPCLWIEAAWHLDEDSKMLRLSQLTADRPGRASAVAIGVSAAGPIRLNLGRRQYNVFPGNGRSTCRKVGDTGWEPAGP
jgi:hypothetical protein